MAGTWNITHIRGDHFTFDFTVYDRDDETGVRTARDLSNFTGRMQIRSGRRLLLDLDDTHFTMTALGAVTIVAEGVTMELSVGEWVYDIELRDGSNNPETILGGTFTITEDATY